MSLSTMRPLSQKEQEFASKCHSIVFAYLNKRSLSYDEFYDVVIFGYIRAVAKYHDHKILQKYSFSTIAWRSMDCEYGNYIKSLHTQKRKEEMTSISLDQAVADTENCTIGDTIPSTGEIYDELEYRELLHETVSLLPFLQRKILFMKLNGNTKTEISKAMKLSV